MPGEISLLPEERYLTVELMGGFGNQLFMVATLLATAKKHGMTPFISRAYDATRNRSYERFFAGIPFCRENTGTETETSEFVLVREPRFCHDEIIVPAVRRVKLHGYFQSWKYFHHLRDEIFSAFNVEFHRKQAAPRYREIASALGDDLVAVHVRRMDYLQLSEYHNVLTQDYYRKCIDVLGKDRGYLIFSDDIEHCKRDSLFGSLPRVHFLQEDGPVSEMFVVSMCRDLVIANSSFSWWCAYLGAPERVFYPVPWFGPRGPKMSYDDLCLPHWTPVADGDAAGAGGISDALKH
ncbi:MAG: alpha-1,2-fucosyltransferase [Sulfobacillus sp.]